LTLSTRGRVEKTFGSDDIARHNGKRFPFPEGYEENVVEQPFGIEATPEDPDDEFTYAVHTAVTVT
jgi:hypothetical protein